MMKLITWEMDRSHAPADPAERLKLTMAHGEMVKNGIDSGKTCAAGVLLAALALTQTKPTTPDAWAMASRVANTTYAP